ncbi:MAG: hypothetical protein EKK62_16465 [Acidimicrobiia bacterium]|nr:MAG: hypothetical protein EKK62_16465 [Acidimicrobiia bacterium]
MAYLDDLIAASIGGVAFWVDETTEMQTGRRTVVTQIPGSDTVAFEDLGALATVHDVRALLIGDDATAQARAVARVFDKPGPYDYVHRIYGPRQVVLAPGSRPRITVAENRLRAVSVTFSLVEVKTQASITVAPALAGKVKVTASALSLAAIANYAKKASKLGKVFSGVVAAINKLAGKIRAVKRKALGPLAVVDDLDAALDNLEAAAEELAGVPEDLGAALNKIMAEMFSLMLEFVGPTTEAFEGEAATAKIEAALAAVFDVADIELVDPLPFPEAPHDADLAADQGEIETLALGLALAGCFGVFGEVAPASSALVDYSTDAVGEIADLILQDEGVGIDLHVATRDARDAVLARISEATRALPNVRVIVPVVQTSAVLVAWEVMGDPTRAAEIVARNRLQNPAFIVDEIEVVDG